jgi:serine/threonine-protein kinase
MAAALAEGRYRLEQIVGRGGMATVYLAHDDDLERWVAVKVVREELVADAATRDRFLREARLAARLAHPNVVRVYDAGESDGRPFIVMEHVEGTTLAEERSSRGRLDPEAVIRIGQEVCAGLEHAHAAGLVHRDVKPQNLLLAADGTVKIADFGIAHAIDQTRMTLAGTVLGTAAYLAPEQARDGPIGPAADVYALGAVLYELLTGRPPHVARTLPELVARHALGQVVPPSRAVPGLVPELDQIVLACLQPDPAARPTPSELADALGSVLESDTSTVALDPPTVRLEPTRRRQERRRRRPLLLGLALLAAAAGVAMGAVAASSDGGSNAGPGTPELVAPPSTNGQPADVARSLADWLREHSG